VTTARVLALPAAAVLVACAGAPARTPGIGADSAETRAIVAAAGAVERRGDTLRITGTGKVTAVLIDDTTGGEDYHVLRYDGRIPGTPYHGVALSYFEGRGYLLVHERTAKQSRLDARPVASPAGGWLATASFDLEAGFDANAVEILRPVRDTVESAWRIDPVRWGPDSVAWRSEDTLLVVQRWATDSGPGRYERREARVVRRGTAWALEPPDSGQTGAP
jgi:hypothetical protein